jgi:hypothetical protein
MNNTNSLEMSGATGEIEPVPDYNDLIEEQGGMGKF